VIECGRHPFWLTSQGTDLSMRDAHGEPETTIASRSPLPKSVALVLALGAAAVLVCGIIMAVSLWRVVPFYDSWSMVTTFMQKQEGSLSFCNVIAQQNEHRIVWHRLLALADFAYFRSTHRLLYPTLLISYLGLGAFLGWLVARGECATVRAMMIISSMALLVSPIQLDNLAQPVQTGMAYAILFSGIAFLSVGLLAESTTRRQKVAYTAISAAAIILAAFSMLQGLVGASLVVIVACLLRVPALSRGVLIAVLGACIVVYFFWPCGYRWPVHHQPFFASFYSIKGIAEFAGHTAIHLGIFGGLLGLKPAVTIGSIGIALWLLALLVIVRRWRPGRQIDSTLTALIGIATVMVATAVVTAFGRAGFGVHQATSPRYATEGLVFWMCLFGIAWRFSDALASRIRSGAGASSIDRGASSWGVRPVAPSLVARSLMLCIAAVIIVLSYYAWFSMIGQNWRYVIAENQLLAQELRMGIFNEERARLSYPRPEIIPGFVKFLRDNKLSIFAE